MTTLRFTTPVSTSKGWAPFAIARRLPVGDNDPVITPRAAILHVAASLATTLFFFFRDRSGGIESHFYITLLGKIEQYRSIYRQADANLEANDFAVSIETAGLAGGRWNPLQRRAIKRLLLWLNDETNGAIPLRRCDSPRGSGIGFHTMWGSPSPWTPVAKSCPGPERIRQFNNWLVPWLASALEPPAKFRAVTFNVWVGQRGRKLRRNLRALMRDTDYPALIALQEARGLRRGFLTYRRIASGGFDRRDANNNVLLVRRRHVELVRRIRLAIMGPTWEGPHEGITHPPRVFNGGLLVVDGLRLAVLVVHRVTGGNRRNRDAWLAEGRQLRAWVQQHVDRYPLLIAGDWQRGGGRQFAQDVEARADVLGIDGFVSDGLRVGALAKLEDTYGSDGHRPVVATFHEVA